jgi:ribonuclease HII
MPCDDAHERRCRADGFAVVAGIDEVGRGALAGPVVAAAVVLDPDRVPVGIDDSKRLRPALRERLAADIRAWSVAQVEADEIDRVNILRATLAAMRKALDGLCLEPDLVLIDGSTALPNFPRPQRTIVGGDGASVSIAAASIVAKVVRDALMRDLDSVWHGYGFAAHAGYGTRTHREAIRRLGPSPIHRRTFRGVCQEQPSLLE